MTDDKFSSSAAGFPLPSSVRLSKIDAGSGFIRVICLQKINTP